MRQLRIGEDVEDILNLAYQLLGTDFHKIDMRWAMCRTLKNTGDDRYEKAALAYIQVV